MKSEEFDFIVIGGGITGAGVARDAAGRGLKVALIEADDFASGTSSRSSKLIHGGVRYLENLEFHLVFEALSERGKLFNMAPHLVHPLRFLIPIYKHSRVGMFKMGLGMMLYDALSLFKAPKLHERLNAGESLSRLPALKPNELKGSYVYSDAYMDDDRLVHETLRSANTLGAVQANYVRATGAIKNDEGKVTGITCKDSIGDEEFSIRGTHVISTVGVWTDDLGDCLLPNWKKIMRPSKGIHLTFLKERLPLENAVVMGAESRIVFGIPRNEMVIVGTTDTDYEGELSDVHSTAEDVKYLLQVANEYFPGANLTHEDIVASYAGVRPLVDDGSDSEGKTSREHTIISHPKNITFVAGGKYTTYRNMAEEAVDKALAFLALERIAQLSPCQSDEPLNPKVDGMQFQLAQLKIKEWADIWGKSEQFVSKLVQRHGFEAEDIFLSFSQNHMEKSEEELLWSLELDYALKHTMCVSLRDFVLRRVPVFLSFPDNGEEHYGPWAEQIVGELGSEFAKKDQLIDEMHRHSQSELGWKSNLLD